MIWTRRGLVLSVPPETNGWKSHAQAPTPLVLGPRQWRIYFGARTPQNSGRMFYIDVDPLDDMRILDRCYTPILSPGPPGSFDSAGQNASSALIRNGAVHLYFSGMHLRRDVPYGLGVGLAISQDGHAFARAVPGPVLGTGPLDPWFSSVAHVSVFEGGLRAWYTSGAGWVETPDGPDPVYGLGSAESPDGIHWTRRNVLIPHSDTFPGLARPCLVAIHGTSQLFYARRGGLGFRSEVASTYALVHHTLDHAGQPVADAQRLTFANPPEAGDWDGFMQTYPSLVPLNDGYVMFYNGNGFGAGGFGWATTGL